MTYVPAPRRRRRCSLRYTRKTPRVGVLEISRRSATLYARPLYSTRKEEEESGRWESERERKGGKGELKRDKRENQPRARRAWLSGIRITSGCRNYCPVGRSRAANGTGCFALVETNDKSRKLNRRYRLSIAVRRTRRTAVAVARRRCANVSASLDSS